MVSHWTSMQKSHTEPFDFRGVVFWKEMDLRYWETLWTATQGCQPTGSQVSSWSQASVNLTTWLIFWLICTTRPRRDLRLPPVLPTHTQEAERSRPPLQERSQLQELEIRCCQRLDLLVQINRYGRDFRQLLDLNKCPDPNNTTTFITTTWAGFGTAPPPGMYLSFLL